MKHLKLIALALFVQVGAAAQEVKIISFPEIGIDNTVPAGGDIYSRIKLYTIQGAQIDIDTKAGDWLLEQPVSAGTKLIQVASSTKFKACVPFHNSFDARGPCFIDDDGDGKFDRHAKDNITIARRFKTVVPYSKIPVSVSREDSFKSVILYQGANSDSIRFSYREFNNDMARSAFTEDIIIPREKFPTMILIKNLQIEIKNVSGMGLQYRIVDIK